MTDFHLGDILSITTGRMLAPEGIGGVYRILNHLTGDDLMTHQLPRAARECEGPLRAQFPDLPTDVPDLVGAEPYQQWLADRCVEHGTWHEVAPLAKGDHTRIDPLEEWRMLRPDVEIIPVVVPGGDGRD